MFYFIVKEDIDLSLVEEIGFEGQVFNFHVDSYEGFLFKKDFLNNVLDFFKIQKAGFRRTHINEIRRVFVLPHSVKLEKDELPRLSQIIRSAKINFYPQNIDEIFEEKKIFYNSIEGIIRDKILKFSAKNISEYKDNLLEEAKPYVDKVSKLDSDIKMGEKNLSDLKEKILKIENAESGASEYDSLLNIDKVISVEIRDKKMLVFTDLLFAVDSRNGQNHEIGKFRIEIPINGEGKVRWFNLTRQINAYKNAMQAPHVWADGGACLGNTKSTFSELIKNYEFCAAALVAISFVESANVKDGAGKYIKYWPKA